MEDLEQGTTGGDNQGAPTDTSSVVDAAAAEQSGAGDKTGKAGTSDKTAKPEFSDPNMQARFTQRMQEFSAKEKALNDKIAGMEKKVSAFDKISSDKEASRILREYYDGQRGGKKDVAAQTKLSQEDFLAISTDPEKFDRYVADRATALAKQMLQEQLGPLTTEFGSVKEKIAQQELERDISNFSELKDNDGNPLYPDFYDHVEAMTPLLEKFSKLDLTNEQKLEMAYKLVKFPDSKAVKEQVAREAQQIVDKKRKATGDKGGVGSSSFSRASKPAKSVEDIVLGAADSMQWKT